jgi:membrane associated rhomboid family serine protease
MLFGPQRDVLLPVPLYRRHHCFRHSNVFETRNNSKYNSLGASGGVSAVLFAAILYAPLMTVSLYFFIQMPGFIFGLLFLGYSFYEAKRGTSYVNHSAHMYGALFGMIFMAVVYPPQCRVF